MASQEIERLLTLCKTGTAKEKCRAIVDLEDLRAREAVPVLLGLSSSPDTAVRANVASALGKLGSCESVAPALLHLLADPETLVRVTAIQSLGELGCTESASRLRGVLTSDPDPLVRLQAAETLGMLKDGASLPSLKSALSDPDEGVRAEAAEALGLLEVRGAVPDLNRLERSPLVRASLLGALYQLGDEAALILLLDEVEGMDDQTAITALNLAVDLARPEHLVSLRSRLEALARSRPTLAADAESLLRKVPAPR